MADGWRRIGRPRGPLTVGRAQLDLLLSHDLVHSVVGGQCDAQREGRVVDRMEEVLVRAERDASLKS